MLCCVQLPPSPWLWEVFQMSGSIRVWPFANILLLIFLFTQRFGRSFESVMFLEDCWDKGKDVQNVTHTFLLFLSHTHIMIYIRDLNHQSMSSHISYWTQIKPRLCWTSVLHAVHLDWATNWLWNIMSLIGVRSSKMSSPRCFSAKDRRTEIYRHRYRRYCLHTKQQFLDTRGTL